MDTTALIYIAIAVIVVLLVIWLVRSRGNTSGHIDTSATAIGAATEAVEDLVDSVTHRAEGVMEADAAASGAKAEDVQALEAASAAIMANAGGVETIVPAGSGEPDNLRKLKGVGPKLATRLGELGITRFDQIAAWSEADIDAVDAQLGTFKGRIRRDNWVEQAGFLAKGDVAGFEARFGKLDSPGNK